MIYAGILAGGTGVRMGGNIPKQFMHIGKKPIIIHTIERFLNTCDKVIVACPKPHIAYMTDIINKYIAIGAVSVIEGGNTRMDSMLCVLAYIFINFNTTDKDIIVTHDGVRPFVSEDIIEKTVQAAAKKGAAAPFLNATDTVAVSLDGEKLERVLTRDCVYSVQTPQTFKLLKLKKIFKNAGDDIYKYTDLCGMAMSQVADVYMVPGDRKNIKITTREDIYIAQAILKAEEENENR